MCNGKPHRAMETPIVQWKTAHRAMESHTSCNGKLEFTGIYRIYNKIGGTFLRRSGALFHEAVLHFHEQDALNRLIYVVDGQFTLLDGLFESSDHGRYLAGAVWPFNQVIAGHD